MQSDHAAIAVIPARIGSTRFPRKLLADKTGKPLIVHVVERVRQAASIARIIVATDHKDIYSAVADAGADVVMTSANHPNGTSRIAEVVANMPDRPEIVVNVQGDEPEIEPEVIDLLVAGLRADPEAPMATLVSEFQEGEDPANPNIVKVLVDQQQRAIYFSRALVPFDRDRAGITPLKHPGIYAYRPDFLLEYVKLPATPLEQIEKLEQLRAIEHGYKIAVIQTRTAHHGIDTPEQYEQFVERWRAQAAAAPSA